MGYGYLFFMSISDTVLGMLWLNLSPVLHCYRKYPLFTPLSNVLILGCWVEKSGVFSDTFIEILTV